MQIIIDYESSWRNSFLDGSNNEALPKTGRKFIASMTELKKDGNFKKHFITKDTVMGILNRLIGEQRKLYQSRSDQNYYFKNIEAVLRDSDIDDQILHKEEEMIFLRNISGSTDQNSFSGMVQDNHITFNSDYSKEFWGILWLSFDELIRFIMDDEIIVDSYFDRPLSALNILDKALKIEDYKNENINDKITSVINLLAAKFPDLSYVENNGTIKLMRFYAAALYLQLDRLSKKYDLTSAVNIRGKATYIYGFSKRGFNGNRDFMKNFVTGGEKKIWGNPYMLKTRVKGQGEVTDLLTKASGRLTINLDIPFNEARDLEEKIENAGVSSFYLGKKGLAYVSDIRV